MFWSATTMCDAAAVAAIEGELRRVVAALDPESVPLAEAPGLWVGFDRIEKLAAGAKTLLARRVEESGVWRREGFASAGHYLARRSGSSVGQAKNRVETSKRLRSLPETTDAVRQGELSPTQTDTITDAAAVSPSAEADLVRAAKRESLAELRDRCARTKAAAEDSEGRYRRVRANRTCQQRTTRDGAGEILYRSTVDDIAEVWSVIEGYANREFRTARAEGRREPHDAYLADGMLAMARAAAGGTGRRGDGTPPGADAPPDGNAGGGAAKRPLPRKLIVRIDWDALVRGWPIDGETSEIAGVGPVPVSVVRSMLESGDAFLASVVTRGVDVLNVAHLRRRPTAYQITGLEWRDPTCTVQGCNRTAGLQTDHREDWADTKITLLDLLNRLCAPHHRLKTTQGWKLVDGEGKRPMVPPGHPQHPDTHPPPEERPERESA